MLKIAGVMGVSRDLPDRDTGVEYVHDANNIKAAHGKYSADFGMRTIDTLPDDIYHMEALDDARYRKLLMLGDTKAYAWDGNVSTDITETGEELVPLVDGEHYSSDQISGMGVFAQINDYPRAYGDPAVLSSKIVYLPWDAENTWSDKDTRSPVIRNYKNFLVTLGESTSLTYDPRKVRWSDSVTDTGVLPYWEPTPEGDAGFVTLSDLDDIVDGLQLQDAFVIYSATSAYLMQYVGGQFVMRFRRLPLVPGVMAKNLVMEVEGSHFVVGSSDIYIHNTSGPPQSLIDKRLRDVAYGRLNAANLSYAFLVKNWQDQEIWLCVGDTTGSSIAFSWNWKSNTWTTREIPNSYFGVSGLSPVDFLTYEGLSVYPNYDSIPGTYDGLGPKEENVPEMLFSTTSQTLVQKDTGVLEDDQCGCLIERHGVTVGAYNEHFTILTVYPAVAVSPVTIEVGMQYHEDGPIQWSAPQVFDPHEDKKLDLRGDNITGSLFCYRLYNQSPALFQFTGMEVDLRPSGND